MNNFQKMISRNHYILILIALFPLWCHAQVIIPLPDSKFDAKKYRIKDTVTIVENTFLFTEDGDDIDGNLIIWMVKTNKSHSDTIRIFSITLHFYDGFETDYSAVASEYDVIGDKFILYSHSISTFYTLETSTVTKSHTQKETFVIQKHGKVVRLDRRYGMVNEKVLDKELDNKIRARTDHYFPYGRD